MKHLSNAAHGLIGQPMFQLLTRVKMLEESGRAITRFEIGDSAFPDPPHVVEATRRALAEGKTRYVQSQGIPELRDAIADQTLVTHGFRPSLEQIAILPANGVIDAVVRCVMNPGEDVVIPDPGFPTYRAVVSYTGVNAIAVPQREGTDRMFIDPAELEQALTPTTRLIISNSPNNPTGMMLTHAETAALYRTAEKHDVYLLSDEVYSRLTYGTHHFSPSTYDRCRERTLVLNSFSKGYAMSGWRLGYVIGPPEVIAKIALLFETMYSCVPPFVQYAGIAALTENREYFDQYARQLQDCRDLMVAGLNSLPGVSCITPAGAIYAFANITGTGLTSQQFADVMLSHAQVALLPGSTFGEQGEGYVRLCFARPPAVIEEGCSKMKEALKGGALYETIGLHRAISR